MQEGEQKHSILPVISYKIGKEKNHSLSKSFAAEIMF
jgi:hypothetical protein